MTKLLEWVSVLFALFSIWYTVVGGYVRHPFFDEYMTFIKYSPITFVFLFGLYAVIVVLYRVYTFNDCPKAADELRHHISVAKEDLRERGLVF